MTDNDIIKALNYCCGNIKNNDDECQEDMCYQVCMPESRDEGIRWCRQWLMKDALDLINRQKAEIESLKIFRGYAEKRANDYRTMRDKYLNAKSEAYKEFAKLLRRQSFDRLYVSVDEINNLLKEMAGEDKKKKKE